MDTGVVTISLDAWRCRAVRLDGPTCDATPLD